MESERLVQAKQSWTGSGGAANGHHLLMVRVCVAGRISGQMVRGRKGEKRRREERENEIEQNKREIANTRKLISGRSIID